MKRRLLIASALALGLGLPARAQQPAAVAASRKRPAVTGGPQKLVFGLIALKNAEQSLADWSPFIQAMGSSLGIPVEGKAFAMQGELIEAFDAGAVDISWVGNVPALTLVESGRAAVFAQMLVNGQASYRSVIVTHVQSPIRTLDDLQAAKGRYIFGDGDLKSTSGHLVPRYFAWRCGAAAWERTCSGWPGRRWTWPPPIRTNCRNSWRAARRRGASCVWPGNPPTSPSRPWSTAQTSPRR